MLSTEATSIKHTTAREGRQERQHCNVPPHLSVVQPLDVVRAGYCSSLVNYCQAHVHVQCQARNVSALNCQLDITQLDKYCSS